MLRYFINDEEVLENVFEVEAKNLNIYNVFRVEGEHSVTIENKTFETRDILIGSGDVGEYVDEVWKYLETFKDVLKIKMKGSKEDLEYHYYNLRMEQVKRIQNTLDEIYDLIEEA